MLIQPATPNQAPEIAALYRQLTGEMSALAPTVIQPLHQDNAADFYDYLIDPQSDIFITTDQSRIVGFALVLAATTGVELEAVFHRFALCVDLYVQPAYRHQGRAQALLTAVDDWAKAHACEFVQLNVLAANTQAQQFYQQAGFLPQQLTLTRPVRQQP
ncbi:GNAT family N-acetyltransferase [Lacticaseibacillus baoqingensis]|uniref:GNAT family N-acetyltransferase n=2 Tax=Lacticaseibacillus baoqingensis TaxID=2486013 RepID=A0ABW4E9H0_9LACO